MVILRTFVLGAAVVLLSCGSSKPPCGPSNCNTCCTADGLCVLQASNLSCGAFGAACFACLADQQCTSGLCVGGGGGGSPDAGRYVTDIEIDIYGASQSARIEQSGGSLLPASTGYSWVTVDLALLNGTSASAPLSPALFTLSASGGMEVPGAAQTATLPGGCPVGASVAKDGVARCKVLFSMPSNQLGDRLRYQKPDGKVLERPVSVVPCTSCASLCVDLQTDPENCGACGNDVGQGLCKDGLAVCAGGLTRCGNTCVNLLTDSNNCGACGNGAGLGMICRDGTLDCTTPGLPDGIYCGGQCVNSIGNQHCGTCTRDCTTLNADCGDYALELGVDRACGVSLSSRTSCTGRCGTMSCAGIVTYYACSGGGYMQGKSTDCTSIPPDSLQSAEVCTFAWSECVCQ